MTIPAPIQVRLDRARVHIDELGREFDAMNEPESERPRAHVERDGDWYVLLAPTMAEPSPHLAAVAGEAIQAMRAALDYAVVHAIREGGHKPTRSNAFPVTFSDQDWCKRVVSPDDPKRAPLRGLDPKGKTWAAIRSAQPYMRSLDPEVTHIAALAALSNRDKHESLLEFLPMPSEEDVQRLISWNPDAVVVEQRFAEQGPLSHEHETELVRVRFSAEGPEPAVRVQGSLRISPTFGEDRYAAPIGFLRLLLDHVAQVVTEIVD